MSGYGTTWAWEHSKAKGLDLLVLLAVAEWNADPEVIAPWARTTPEGVKESLRRLDDLGDLDALAAVEDAVQAEWGRYMIDVYRPEWAS